MKILEGHSITSVFSSTATADSCNKIPLEPNFEGLLYCIDTNTIIFQSISFFNNFICMKQLDSQLAQLRLHGMAKTLQTLIETRKSQDLSFDDGLELLLQAEQDDRANRRYGRLKKNATFRYAASIEQLNFDAARGLDKSLVTRLAMGDYVSKGESILITGSTGCGKSYLATALGHQACIQGHKVAYFNLNKLVSQIKIARVAGSHSKLLDKIAKTNLLILDDFGLSNWDAQQRLDMLEIFEDRHARNATIIVSQIPIKSWYELIGEATIADAILDRLIHTSHRIELKGDSLRKKQ
jgi:DNA replication protein DnaC